MADFLACRMLVLPLRERFGSARLIAFCDYELVAGVCDFSRASSRSAVETPFYRWRSLSPLVGYVAAGIHIPTEVRRRRMRRPTR